MYASSYRWFIVIAYTSGGGFMLNKETLQSSRISVRSNPNVTFSSQHFSLIRKPKNLLKYSRLIE